MEKKNSANGKTIVWLSCRNVISRVALFKKTCHSIFELLSNKNGLTCARAGALAFFARMIVS